MRRGRPSISRNTKNARSRFFGTVGILTSCSGREMLFCSHGKFMSWWRFLVIVASPLLSLYVRLVGGHPPALLSGFFKVSRHRESEMDTTFLPSCLCFNSSAASCPGMGSEWQISDTDSESESEPINPPVFVHDGLRRSCALLQIASLAWVQRVAAPCHCQASIQSVVSLEMAAILHFGCQALLGAAVGRLFFGQCCS